MLPVVVACHFRLFQVSALDLEHEHQNLSAVTEIQLLNFKMQTAVKFHVISIGVCVRVRACMRNGRSREVIRPLAKYYCFLWAMAIVGHRKGAQ